LTLARTTPFGGNPGADADVDLLTDVAGDDGFATKAALPSQFSNPWPFQNDISDFLLWESAISTRIWSLSATIMRKPASRPASKGVGSSYRDVEGFTWAL
jgi:hypothetical protein